MSWPARHGAAVIYFQITTFHLSDSQFVFTYELCHPPKILSITNGAASISFQIFDQIVGYNPSQIYFLIIQQWMHARGRVVPPTASAHSMHQLPHLDIPSDGDKLAVSFCAHIP